MDSSGQAAATGSSAPLKVRKPKPSGVSDEEFVFLPGIFALEPLISWQEASDELFAVGHVFRDAAANQGGVLFARLHEKGEADVCHCA